MDHRPLRVSKLIKRELSKIIEREIEFEGALATITEVQVDPKLEHAEVLVGILPKEKEAESFNVLREARGKLQSLLMKKINIKPMPRIEFKIDYGAENAAKIEKRFLEIQKDGPDAQSGRD